MRASGGGILGFENGLYINDGGTIQALNNSEVQFRNLATIQDGTLDSSGSGVLRVLAGINVFFEDVTNDGNMVSDNGSDFGISGTFTNNGNVSIQSAGAFSDLEVQAGGATIDGGGTITLDGSFPRINGVSSSLLVIEDQTIEGRGAIGAGTISLDNQGNLIDANVDGQELRLDLSLIHI